MKNILFLFVFIIIGFNLAGTFDPIQEQNLIKLKVGDKYQKAKLYKLNPKGNYYGKNTIQMIFTKNDTVRTTSYSKTIINWKCYVTFRKADSVIIRIISNWQDITEQP